MARSNLKKLFLYDCAPAVCTFESVKNRFLRVVAIVRPKESTLRRVMVYNGQKEEVLGDDRAMSLPPAGPSSAVIANECNIRK